MSAVLEVEGGKEHRLKPGDFLLVKPDRECATLSSQGGFSEEGRRGRGEHCACAVVGEGQ